MLLVIYIVQDCLPIIHESNIRLFSDVSGVCKVHTNSLAQLKGETRPRGPALNIEFVGNIFNIIALVCEKFHLKVVKKCI